MELDLVRVGLGLLVGIGVRLGLVDGPRFVEKIACVEWGGGWVRVWVIGIGAGYGSSHGQGGSSGMGPGQGR